MTEYSIDDVAFSIAHDLSPDATPVDVRDDVVWLPDGLTLDVSLPDREPVVAGVCLRSLVQWYGQVSSVKSGTLAHAHGHWSVTHDGDCVSLDLSEHVRESRESDGSDGVVESGPRVIGTRTAVLRELEELLDASFGVLERHDVAADDVVAELASDVDTVDRELLSKWDPDA